MSEIKANRISREHYDRLDQRRRWLTNRIEAKVKTGWETQYDESERDALAAALEVLEVDTTPNPGEGWRIASGDDWKDERCEIWFDNQWVKRPAVNSGRFPLDKGSVYRIPIDPEPKHPPIPEGWMQVFGEMREGYKYCIPGDEYWTEAPLDIPKYTGKAFVIRRIEPTYRPFASAEEFDSHAHRIVVNVSTGTRRRIDHYSDRGCMGMSWDMAHRKYRFLDDGSPFGVEVKG